MFHQLSEIYLAYLLFKIIVHAHCISIKTDTRNFSKSYHRNVSLNTILFEKYVRPTWFLMHCRDRGLGSLAWRERNLPPPKLPLPSYMYKVDLILIRLNAHFVENTQRVFTTTKIGLFSIHYCPKNSCSSCHRFVAMMCVKTKIVIRARN